MNTEKHLCGLECKFLKKSDVWSFFDFSDLALDKYYFQVVDAAVFSNRTRIKVLEKFQHRYFQELIKQSFVGERLVLHLYPEATPCVEIENYEDFSKSKCEMIILLYDFCYMEIYCKRRLWIEQLIHKANNISGSVVERKFEETDPRTTMYV